VISEVVLALKFILTWDAGHSPSLRPPLLAQILLMCCLHRYDALPKTTALKVAPLASVSRQATFRFQQDSDSEDETTNLRLPMNSEATSPDLECRMQRCGYLLSLLTSLYNRSGPQP